MRKRSSRFQKAQHAGQNFKDLAATWQDPEAPMQADYPFPILKMINEGTRRDGYRKAVGVQFFCNNNLIDAQLAGALFELLQRLGIQGIKQNDKQFIQDIKAQYELESAQFSLSVADKKRAIALIDDGYHRLQFHPLFVDPIVGGE